MAATRRWRVLWVLSALGMAAGAAAQQQNFDPEKATFEFFTDRTTYAPGETARIAARVRIEPGWHVHSNTPTFDYLIATALRIEPPAGWEAPVLSYPEGEMQAFSFAHDTPLSVYDGEVTIVGRLRVPSDVRPRPVPVKVALRYQACNDRVCLPPVTKRVTTVLPVGEGGEPAHGEVFGRP